MEIASQEQFDFILEENGYRNTFFKADGWTIECPLVIEGRFKSIEFTNWKFTDSVRIDVTNYDDPEDRIDGEKFVFNCFNCVFESELNLEDSTFQSKTRFHNCEFQGINVRNTTFEDLADFWGSIFSQRIIFYKTDFLGTTVFSTATFKENVLFTYSLISKLLILRGTIVEKGFDLSLAIISGDLGLFDFKLTMFETVNYKGEKEYEDQVSNSTNAGIPKKNRRETFRIIKKYHDDQKNRVELQDFSSLESRAHFRELRYSIWIGERVWSSIWNIIILTLNLISNNHGKSYLTGLIFTAWVGLIFFSFSITGLDGYDYYCLTCWEWNWDLAKYYFQFLLPTHKVDFMNDFAEPQTGFYIFDFLGRVFVSYGIYQTVQAFRKFR